MDSYINPKDIILYEDNHLLVVNKPSGWLAQSDGSSAPDIFSWSKNYIKTKYQKPGEVYLGLLHRLDRNVSGVMVMARTSKAAARLSKNIREHNIQKKYSCLVEGIPGTPTSRLVDFIKKDPVKKMAVAVSPKEAQAQEAILDYEMIRQIHRETLKGIHLLRPDLKAFSLLEVELVTGRFHQIRLQMSRHIGPIVGDRKYQSQSYFFRHSLCLHCHAMTIDHPVQKIPLTFRAPLPGHWNFF